MNLQIVAKKINVSMFEKYILIRTMNDATKITIIVLIAIITYFSFQFISCKLHTCGDRSMPKLLLNSHVSSKSAREKVIDL